MPQRPEAPAEEPATVQLQQSPEQPIVFEIAPERRTMVYGTAQPTRGLPGTIRAAAYRRPWHDPVHWFLLLLADRVEVCQEMLREATTPGRQQLLLRRASRLMRAHPEGYLAWATVGLVLATLLLRPRRRRRRDDLALD